MELGESGCNGYRQRFTKCMCIGLPQVSGGARRLCLNSPCLRQVAVVGLDGGDDAVHEELRGGSVKERKKENDFSDDFLECPLVRQFDIEKQHMR